MLEPDVTLTDYALTLECLVIVGMLVRRKAKVARALVVPLFVAMGAASFFGGTVHGFFPDVTTVEFAWLWRATLLSIGLAACFAWCVGGALMVSGRTLRLVQVLAAANFVAYAGVVLALNPPFVVAVVNYLPSVIFLLLAFTARGRRERDRASRYGVAGIWLTLVAAACQQAKWGLHPEYFNHNAVYHTVQAIGVWFLYLGLR